MEREQQFWVIKTTEGGGTYDVDHWDDFKTEQAIAVGWAEVKVDPCECTSKEDFHDRVSTGHYRGIPRRSQYHIASTIWSFAKEWNPGDLAAVCVGYSPRQECDVCLYGLAEVGDYEFDSRSQWGWIYKRKTKLWAIEEKVSVRTFRDALKKGSVLQTIHGPLSKQTFLNFSAQVQKLFPTKWHGLTQGCDGYFLPAKS